MSYRFTETNKWEDKWFRKLNPTEKILFNFICDKCDIAGFWEIDLELASIFTGIAGADMQGAFEGLSRAYFLNKNNSVLWVKNFIRHQRNWPLNEKNNAHKAIIAILNSHVDFEVDFFQELHDKNSVLLGPKEAPCKGKGNGNGKGKSKGKSRGKGRSKRKLKKFVPPTQAEVVEYVKNNPELSNVDPVNFWKGFDDGGWIDTQGKPVRNWKLKLRTWSNYGQSGKSKHANQKPAGQHIR